MKQRTRYQRLTHLCLVFSLVTCCAALARTTATASGSQPVTELTRGQTGRIYFETTNPSDYKAIMTDKPDTRKTTIWGTLTIPAGTTGKVPTVIILGNPANNKKDHDEVWAKELNKAGYATFVVDHKTPRENKRYSDQKHEIHSPTFVADAYAALNLLSTHPRIDANKIAVIGWSKSGQAAHFAASDLIRSKLAKPGVKFAAHVGVYPVCSFTLHNPKMTGAPILFLMGKEDNKALAGLCTTYAERIRKTGVDAEVIVYPGAYWGWDINEGKRTIESVNTANCYVEFLDDGDPADPSDGSPISYKELGKILKKCLKKGYTAAYNPDATKQSIEDTKKFLSKALATK